MHPMKITNCFIFIFLLLCSIMACHDNEVPVEQLLTQDEFTGKWGFVYKAFYTDSITYQYIPEDSLLTVSELGFYISIPPETHHAIPNFEQNELILQFRSELLGPSANRNAYIWEFTEYFGDSTVIRVKDYRTEEVLIESLTLYRWE